MAKAVLIDAKNQTVKEVDYNGNIEQMYELLGCRLICVALQIGNNHTIYVDDEGYLNGTKEFFKFKEIETQWFAGSGLILVEDPETEEYLDHQIDLKRLADGLLFMQCDDEESCPELPPMKIITWD